MPTALIVPSLIVASSPLNQACLRLGAEVRDIRQALQRSRNRECWNIESNEATRVDDLRRALLDFRPKIVHFSGHGGGTTGLCFEDENGGSTSVEAKPLAQLFHHFKDELKCVILNACYSDIQAEAIRKEIDYVIGMKAEVDDESARKFAVAFYDGIFAGTDFRTAFDLACTALDLNSLPDADVPVFMTGSHIDNTTLIYEAKVPEIERILFAYLNTPFDLRWKFTSGGRSLAAKIIRHYGDRILSKTDSVQVLGTDQISSEHWRVKVRISQAGTHGEAVYYLRIHDRSIQIEWEASVGLWSLPVRTYLAMPPTEPVIARVTATLGDYYNFDFKDKESEYQNVELQASEFSLDGYVRRETQVYKDLLEILSDGNSHTITVEIRHVSSQKNLPEITRLLSRTWLYTVN